MASAFNSVQSNRDVSAKSDSSGQNFLGSFAELARLGGKADVPNVLAGQSKEFEFWLKAEKYPSKPSKLRTLDDVIAEIEQVLREPR